MAASAIDCYSLLLGTCLSLVMMTGCKKEQPNAPSPPPTPTPHPPVVYNVKVTTRPVQGITGISAFTGGIVIDKSVPALVDFNYIELNTKSDFDSWSSTSVYPYDLKGDSFSCFIEGLHPQTTYYMRARSDDNIAVSGGLLEPVGDTYGDTISFTTDSLYLGMMVNGGIVFFIDSTGEHGLISSLSDLADIAWFIQGPDKITLATSTTDGLANTMRIDYVYPYADYAAVSCASFRIPGWDVIGGNSWFLPAKDQLEKMYLKRTLIGGFSNKTYWSSTEADLDNAYAEDFSNGSQSALEKTLKYGVRPIRQF